MKESNLFKCSICDLKFANNYNLLIQEWYLSSFADKQNLKKHVEAVNEGIKPFKCSVCDLKFAINYNPLIQEWYLSSFADKQNLKKHVEAVHEGIKPFKVQYMCR